MTYLLATDLRSRTTFVAELATRHPRCKRITYSAMPADRPGGDVLVDWRKVPLVIRQAARGILLGLGERNGNL